MYRYIALLLTLPGALFAQGFEIPYTLPKDGKVSLAVYDSQGHMVRTLRSGEAQKAGSQTVKWDGLDGEGKPAPAGEYDWKLLLSQGMKAEYLLSLGTSVGIDHWTAQHGGPYAVEALPDGEVLVGGSTEGAPMIVRLNPKTSRTTWVNDVWAGGGVGDIAVLDGVVYTFHEGGTVRKFNLAKGNQVPGEFRLELPGPELGPTESNKETKRIPFAGNRGPFRIRGKVIFPSGGGELKILAGGQSDSIKAPRSGGEVSFSSPGKDGPQSKMGQYDASNLKEIVFEPGAMVDAWSVESVRIFGVATSLSARDGILAATYPAVNQVGWHDPAGKLLASTEVKDPKALALVDAQTLLVISGNEVVEVKRDGSRKTVITGLSAPHKIALDPTSGQIFVTDLGKSQQVKRFSREGKLEATYGREGGRKPGKYVPEDFILTEGGISADGNGGFWITEPYAAPRRTAHFGADGKLIGEWYGGQQFYTWAAPDPEDADVFWMDSQWGWIMQVKADWENRTWKVLATYLWGDNYSPELVNRFKMAQRHEVKKLDLDKDGKKETYLLSGAGMQKVDEEAGRLRMVSALGMVAGNRAWEWDKFPLDQQPKPWVDAIALLGEDPAKVFKKYRAFAWADANGDYQFQPEEFRLGKDVPVEGKGGFYLTDKLSLIKSVGWGGKPGDPVWEEYPLQGFTASHAPIWDWNQKVPGHILSIGSPKDFLISPQGETYQIVFGAGGDGYTGLDTFGQGHGYTWPANLADATAVVKWSPEGKQIWKVGSLPNRGNQDPGQLHHPVSFAGLVNGTIGVCDKIVQPVVFWTDDGLFAGGLFDRRADDGLPTRVYRWWNGGTDGFDPETGRALIQYDMILGGSLVKRPNGDVLFVAAGWNNCPVFRVTGWDEFVRLNGKVKVATPVAPIPQKGTGLTAEFYPNPNFQGVPSYALTLPQVWMEAERAKKRDLPELKWPNPQLAKAPKLGEGGADSLDLELDEPVRPVLDGKFSARMTGFIEPRFSENYLFSIYRKDGTARLWVNDQLVIEPSEKGSREFSKRIPLEAGRKYPIKLEWSGDPTGELHLNWESLSQQVTHIQAPSFYPAAKK